MSAALPGPTPTDADLARFRDRALAVPDYFMGGPDFITWGLCPVAGHHRDSDSLTRSNAAVIAPDLMEAHPDDFNPARYSHWAVGWTEGLEVRVLSDPDDPTSYTPGFIRAVSWALALENYPVADEDNFSDLEAQEWAESLENGWVGDALKDVVVAALDPDDEGPTRDAVGEIGAPALWGFIRGHYNADTTDTYGSPYLEEKEVASILEDPAILAGLLAAHPALALVAPGVPAKVRDRARLKIAAAHPAQKTLGATA